MYINKKILDNFKVYINNKSENEYYLAFNDRLVPTESFITLPNEDYIIEDNILKFSSDYVSKLSPDNIDSSEFWKVATDNFPLFSISGGVQTISTIEEVNDKNINGAFRMNVLKPVEDMFRKEGENAFILEIGPGWGGLEKLLSAHFSNNNYYAIDVNPLFEHKNIYKTDGKNIPTEIPLGLDMVYSVNVFQHLSKAQRTSYYKQIYIILKEGGKFIFGMFVVTENNKDLNVWGYRDNNGVRYTSFFKQLTPIDTEEELLSELKDIGFEVKQLSPENNERNYITYECLKPPK